MPDTDALRAGHERWLVEEAERHGREHVTFSAWIREDARLWRLYVAASGADVDRARAAWYMNLKAMPRLP